MKDPETTVSTAVALPYQTHRGLDDVPAYATGLQLTLPDGSRVYVAQSATELVLYFDGNVALHYDLEGRFVKLAEADHYWRRSLSGRFLYSRKHTVEEGGGLDREIAQALTAEKVLEYAHERVAAVNGAVQTGTATIEIGKPAMDIALQQITPTLQLAAAYDLVIAAHDAEQFRAIYGRVAVLPPDQYNAFVLQATEGCAYAGCTFCELYQGVAYRRKSLGEFRQHIQSAIDFHGESLRARRSIFLGEANALTQPTATLKDILGVINEHFELPVPEAPSTGISSSWWLGSNTRFDGVSSFLDAFTNPNRTASDYHELRRDGLRRVYVGLESGDNALLKWLKKPATAEAGIRTVKMLRQCDITVGVIVLIGAGGRDFSASHVSATAQVINELGLGRNDYVYFSPLVIYPGSQYDCGAMNAQVEPLTPAEMHQQEQDIRLALRFDSRRGKPYLARYELETFVY